MAEKDENMSDAELDRLLARMSEDVPAPSQALMARVLADAEALRPVPGAPASRPGFWAGLSAALGGWKGAGGLATAGVVGLWIGISPPATLDTAASALLEAISPDPTAVWGGFDDVL